MPANLLALSAAQIDLFITDGFVRIDNAFPRDVAAAARAIHPDDPATWTRPLMAQPPLMPSAPLQLHRPDGTYSAVETAIRRALGRS
ncbi:hypothetical protein VW29_01385 [Devosia limi DSM 17137]|uniref:Uncharacterized protein n=1 Tax=Devosia limi DSM 17137 TaxID=1121477 RepID=A0A0F5LY80_9HYPH|nr:hypothetical protein VW29_01385 [Devosia limi DSM 17137]SHF65399.1 hypothetical protein SAMN02745223_03203 [Devosia limi DSM 17137]